MGAIFSLSNLATTKYSPRDLYPFPRLEGTRATSGSQVRLISGAGSKFENVIDENIVGIGIGSRQEVAFLAHDQSWRKS
jgi:hypothetical protein